MKIIFAYLTLLCGVSLATANTVYVTVGDTGCSGRQNGVAESWKGIPGVVLVKVLPRQPGDPAAQRVFVIVSKSASPTEKCLREALGRRAKRYPIIDYNASSEPATEVLK